MQLERQKSDCPLNQKCLSECLVYNAVVNTSTTKNYFGTCEKNFKERYNNHTSSFKNKSQQKSAELSNYIWQLKENRKNYTIDWLIVMKAPTHRNTHMHNIYINTFMK